MSGKYGDPGQLFVSSRQFASDTRAFLNIIGYSSMIQDSEHAFGIVADRYLENCDVAVDTEPHE